MHEDIYDSFLSAMVDIFEKVKVGLPWEEDTVMGTQVNKEQLEKILAYVDIGVILNEAKNLIADHAT